jgi:syntaxin-binding protein 1
MTSQTIGILEKLRLLMIYVISQGGMQESTRKELLKSIDVRLQRAIRNLGNLGVNVAQVKGASAKHSKERLAEFALRNKTIPLALMRYLPYLSSPVAQLVANTLDEEEWPYVSPPPPPMDGMSPAGGSSSSAPPAKGTSDRKKKTPAAARDWRSAAPKEEEKKKLEDDKRQRFIVFVLGGITFAEMRSIYELAEQKNVNLIIGTHLYFDLLFYSFHSLTHSYTVYGYVMSR